MLFAAACTLGNGTTNASNNTPIPPSPSLLPASSPSPSPTPAGSPASSPSPSPAGSPLSISSLQLHNGEVGVIYLAVSLGATGGTPGYSWSITGGTFPPGLTLSSDGQVTGNNTAAGNFAFTVTVKDSTGATASSGASMHVFTALTVSQPCSATCSVEQGCTICGNFGTVSGGLPPYHLSIVSDNRPTGMGLNGLSLTGAFPPPGQFSIAIKVSDDQFGATRTITAHWSVFAHIALSGQTAFVCGFSGSSCIVQIPYSGGTPGGTPTVKVTGISDAFFFNQDQGPPRMSIPNGPNCFTTAPTPAIPAGLPPGTSVSVSGGIVSLSIGPPYSPPSNTNNFCSYTARVTLILVDESPCGPGNCTTLTSATIDIGI